MTSFYLTFLAVLLASIGARDQILVAGLTLARGRRGAIIAIAVIAACVTAALAVWAAQAVMPMLAPRARSFFGAMALALAGLESLVLVPRSQPREPTRSLGAAILALLLLQLIDASRFLIFAMAIATDAAVPVAIAGAVGGALAVLAGWALPGHVLRPWVGVTRRAIGAVMLVLGLVLGLRVLEIV